MDGKSSPALKGIFWEVQPSITQADSFLVIPGEQCGAPCLSFSEQPVGLCLPAGSQSPCIPPGRPDFQDNRELRPHSDFGALVPLSPLPGIHPKQILDFCVFSFFDSLHSLCNLRNHEGQTPPFQSSKIKGMKSVSTSDYSKSKTNYSKICSEIDAQNLNVCLKGFMKIFFSLRLN